MTPAHSIRSPSIALACLLVGCGGPAEEVSVPVEPPAPVEVGVPTDPLRVAYFGDTHTHSSWSIDAFAANVRIGPDDAYRYAKGERIGQVSDEQIQIRSGPLDFMALAEHSEAMGIAMEALDPDSAVAQTQIGRDLVSSDPEASKATLVALIESVADGVLPEDLDDLELMRSTWREIVEIAERHNDPGTFTTFVAYEWSSLSEPATLHRTVIFAGADVPEAPFSSIDSADPEDLWTFMEAARQTGDDVIAIPHNGNLSHGSMYGRINLAGEPMGAEYSKRRMENEPLSEVFQMKGQSETIPELSPDDEWSDFERYETVISTDVVPVVSGSYVREAYRDGLVMEEAGDVNPYKFGVVGSTDGHRLGALAEEDSYAGQPGPQEASPEDRLSGDDPSPSRFETSAAGLAGVWAESNTRQAIFAAFRRKETFATSGPRIQVRLFGGWDFTGEDAGGDMVRRGYDRGVPMGGELAPRPGDATTPTFLVWASRDPDSAPLQRLQVIKGWALEGASHEKVFDVACSDDGEVDASTHRCPDNGATVDLSDCSTSTDLGATELSTIWKDPEFDAAQRAFYYVRVLENPICRWSTHDALTLDVQPPAGKPATIQERALSSPIWYSPSP